VGTAPPTPPPCRHAHNLPFPCNVNHQRRLGRGLRLWCTPELPAFAWCAPASRRRGGRLLSGSGGCGAPGQAPGGPVPQGDVSGDECDDCAHWDVQIMSSPLLPIWFSPFPGPPAPSRSSAAHPPGAARPCLPRSITLPPRPAVAAVRPPLGVVPAAPHAEAALAPLAPPEHHPDPVT